MFGSEEIGDQIEIRRNVALPEGHVCSVEGSVMFLAVFDKTKIAKLKVVDESPDHDPIDFEKDVFDIVYDGVPEGACFVFHQDLTFSEFEVSVMLLMLNGVDCTL